MALFSLVCCSSICAIHIRIRIVILTYYIIINRCQSLEEILNECRFDLQGVLLNQRDGSRNKSLFRPVPENTFSRNHSYKLCDIFPFLARRRVLTPSRCSNNRNTVTSVRTDPQQPITVGSSAPVKLQITRHPTSGTQGPEV